MYFRKSWQITQRWKILVQTSANVCTELCRFAMCNLYVRVHWQIMQTSVKTWKLKWENYCILSNFFCVHHVQICWTRYWSMSAFKHRNILYIIFILVLWISIEAKFITSPKTQKTLDFKDDMTAIITPIFPSCIGHHVLSWRNSWGCNALHGLDVQLVFVGLIQFFL